MEGGTGGKLRRDGVVKEDKEQQKGKGRSEEKVGGARKEVGLGGGESDRKKESEG